jgi:tetratricopeptide (TPR) repeat protein
MLAAETDAASGNVERAEATLRRIIDADDTSLPAFAALGQLYLAQQRLEPALTQFQRFAARDPTPASRTLVAQILETLGRRDEAKREYEQVLARHPAAPVAANNLAWIYQADGRLDDALRLALAARARLRSAPEISHTLGWIYYQQGRSQEALAALADSVAARPDHAPYRAHLGLAYWKAGRPSQALRELRAALTSPEQFMARSEAEAAARELEAHVESKSTGLQSSSGGGK